MKSGLLSMYSARTRGPNVEEQFAELRARVLAHHPRCLVIDPLSAAACPPVAARAPARLATVRGTDARLVLRLYVAGRALNSLSAIANIRAILDAHFAAGHQLEIVDLLEHPRRALADGIIVTPTLLKLSPLPVQRLIGDLRDTDRVCSMLSTE